MIKVGHTDISNLGLQDISTSNMTGVASVVIAAEVVGEEDEVVDNISNMENGLEMPDGPGVEEDEAEGGNRGGVKILSHFSCVIVLYRASMSI